MSLALPLFRVWAIVLTSNGRFENRGPWELAARNRGDAMHHLHTILERHRKAADVEAVVWVFARPVPAATAAG